MKWEIPQNLRTETHPFRQISVTSFIVGGLSIVLGVLMLLSVKSDFKLGFPLLALEKMVVGVGLLVLGAKWLWRGYQKAHDFNLENVFDPAHGANVNYLLSERSNERRGFANEYAQIMHSKSFSLAKFEKGQVHDWQLLFYRLFSRKGLSRIFDYVPYPITNFIANQSKPVALLAGGIGLLIAFLFFSYLDLLPLSMTWINLFILIGLLSLWRPSKIGRVLQRDQRDNMKNRVIFFIVFFVITVILYRPYADEINISLFLSILLVAAIMVVTAYGSFRLIEEVFSKREMVNVKISAIHLHSYRISTQPNSILQQFDNTMKSNTGWFFRELTRDARGLLAGDQNRKGEFDFEYIYETQPRLFSTKYDDPSEKKLTLIWKAGTLLLCVGIVLMFAGVLVMPGIDRAMVGRNIESALTTYSPKILLSLYLMLLGIAFYFFGNRLVYEVYMFFNTEIFFESDLILFAVSGNYDEFEHIDGNTKRKDTFTDFTPEMMVCKVISSVFMHPYMSKDDLQRSPRFITRIESNEELLKMILGSFNQNMKEYMVTFSSGNQLLRVDDGKQVE